MGLNRRTFLRKTGLGAIALSLNPYLQALAAPTNRKLALLVGIDHYGEGSLDLKGCLTDVELQKELLMHRFGFNAQDIVSLTNEKASRQGIETAFLDHLSKQAQTGDVVVFHYSGYGHGVGLENALLPSNGLEIATKMPSQEDILVSTLEILGRSLATEKYTFILDTSYQTPEPAQHGNLRSRSFPVASPTPNPEELALQLQLSKSNLTAKNRGIILKAASSGQVAAEIRGTGWNAGLFTYSLTQYLWQMTPPSRIITSLARSSEPVEQIRGLLQEPQLEKNSQEALLPYYLLPRDSSGVEGIITRVDPTSGAISLFLVGLSPLIVDHLGVNSLWQVVDKDIRLQIQSRQGLRAKAVALDKGETLEKGQKVRELVRILPKNLKLLVAPDSSLSRIERVDATSAISAIADVNVDGAAESNADVLLSRLAKENQSAGYSLSTLGGFLYVNSAGPANEAVKLALGRLTPKFQSLLAAKYWQLTLNEDSSVLPVAATLEKVSQNREVIIRKQTRGLTLPAEFPSGKGLAKFPQGTNLQLRVENYAPETIYALVLGLDSAARAIISVTDLPVAIAPNSSQSLAVAFSEVFGLQQNYLICSRLPFTETAKVLAQDKSEARGLLSHPVAVARAVVEDLQKASESERTSLGNLPESYALALQDWATFLFIYQLAD